MEFTQEEARLVALGYLEDRLLMIPDGLSRAQQASLDLERGDTATTLGVFRELEAEWVKKTGEIYERRLKFIRSLIGALT